MTETANISDKQQLLEIHKFAHKNLVNYYKAFLSDPEEYVKPADFHFDMCEELLNGKENFAIEMFRQSAKSTYVLRAFPCYALTYPKKSRRYIVILKQNQTLAESVIKEIIDTYKTHPILSMNIVEIHQESAKAFEVTVLGAEGPVRVRIEGYGKGAAIRGLNWQNVRPQVIIGDDLQDLEDSRSDTVQVKDWDWFLSDVFFLGKVARVFMIGNNLGEKCLLEQIITQHKVTKFKFKKVPALDENGKAAWPEQFSVEYLEAERLNFATLGKIDIWYRERMCEAMSEEKRLFKKEYFKYFNDEDIKDKNFIYYLTVDLAISDKQSADDTALMIIGKERSSPKWYVVEYFAGHFDPLDTIDKIFYLYSKYRPAKIGIESVAYQKALFFFIEEEMKRRGVFFNITELKASGRNKEERIKGLQPMIKLGQIYFRENMKKLEEQLLSFPKGLHDDIIDALAYGQDIVNTTSFSQQQKGADVMKRFYMG